MLFTILLFSVACKEQANHLGSQIAEKTLFDTDSLLCFTLQMNLKEVLTDIGENRKYHEAILFLDGISGQKKLHVQVKTRGNFRRDADICNFPLLSIQFDSFNTSETPFQFPSQNILKLVTHCQQDDAIYEQMILEEYAIYKTYQLLTDKSLKVRLLKIKYQDLQNMAYSTEKLAFVIENTKAMAARIGGDILRNKDENKAQDKDKDKNKNKNKDKNKDKNNKDSTQYLDCNSFLMTQTAVFQFMIGNTDWSISNKHNIYILKIPNQNPIAVPYDFDCSGLIDAPYAEPTPELGIENVTTRLYRGYYQSDAELYLVLDNFKTKKQAIDSLWATLTYHDAKRRQKAENYIADFYKIIQNKDSIQHYFLKKYR